ncbi:MAG: hypothetical protein JWL65_916 [Gammaproteobacteria bacterium]|nr:hypothetical protein [Gammaproteobacteria bacterium]
MTVRQLILRSLIAVTVLSALLQLFIDGSIENLAAVLVVLVSSIGILLYIGWTRALEVQPLSAFAIFGFCATTQLGALLAQTAAWTALRSSLYAPLLTFGTLALYQAIALAVHAVYCLFTPTTANRSPMRSLWSKIGVYQTPSTGASWIMGLIGLCAFPFANGLGVLSKICGAFIFLTWAPFLIAIYPRGAADPTPSTLSRTLIVAYALVVCLLGIAFNARGIMFFGVVTVALIYLFVGLRSSAVIGRKTLIRIGALAALALAIAAPLADLATAMEIVRGGRAKTPAMEMIGKTFYMWRRPYALQRYREQKEAATRTAYDEKYIANPLLARFVETKFHDNSLHFAGLLLTQTDKARLADISRQTLWAVLPTPLLKMLGIRVDKEKLMFSTGDYIVYLSRGVPLGGRRTGSMIAEGITLLGGPLFALVYAGMCWVVFVILDWLTVRPAAGVTMLAPVAMMKMWTLFLYGITAESLGIMLTFYGRDVLQMTLTYCLVLAMSNLLLPRRGAASRAPMPTNAAAARGTSGH